MDFSQDWMKLDDRVFATIRIEKGELKFSPDEDVEIVSPTKKYRANVIYSCTTKLKDIPMTFLQYDLEAKKGETRRDLYNKLAKRYPRNDPPEDKDTVTIYLLQRV
jgi:hypothetical protein